MISLLPSATEMVCAVGAEAQLVGISHECDFPPSIRDRRVLTRSRIDPHASSAAIDRAVRAVITDALSIYAVDDAALADLKPDVIVTQDLCEVCAVSLDDVRAAVARIAHREDIRIVSLSPTRLEHVLDDVVRVADALDRHDAGLAVRDGLRRRIADIADRRPATRPRVVTLEWIDPLMIGGTWMPELVELAGGVATGATAGAPAPTVAFLRDLEPDVILIKPCGFSLERALAERDVIERAIAGTRARVYVTDGNQFFNRPGPRLVESLEILAACVHPDRYPDFAANHASAIVHL
ncbi:MAG TPA: ABC transporter substrate-binding protein [Kofleriaceae bacterium]